MVASGSLCALLVACAERVDRSSACPGIAERQMGITREEFAPCAAELLAALDAVRPPVEAVLAGEDASRSEAEAALRQLRALLRSTGVLDDFRSLRPGKEIERWPDGRVRVFNHSVFDASVGYGDVLQYASEDVFQQGVEAHDAAIRYYRQLR
jgi:hypothetical protein